MLEINKNNIINKQLHIKLINDLVVFLFDLWS